jgi:hypothetical protein
LTGKADEVTVAVQKQSRRDTIMDAPPFALAMARASTVYAAHSAEPDAPVVEPRRPRAFRTRSAAAVLLARLATTVEPRPVPHEAPRGMGHAAT